MQKSKQDKINTARIQRAITGLQIPMMQIVALNKHAESIIASGASDQELRDAIISFLN